MTAIIAHGLVEDICKPCCVFDTLFISLTSYNRLNLRRARLSLIVMLFS